MSQWEYKTHVIESRPDYEPVLNDSGKEGWELVAVQRVEPTLIRLIFKRQVNAQPTAETP
jgi:hypothetical protein